MWQIIKDPKKERWYVAQRQPHNDAKHLTIIGYGTTKEDALTMAVNNLEIFHRDCLELIPLLLPNALKDEKFKKRFYPRAEVPEPQFVDSDAANPYEATHFHALSFYIEAPDQWLPCYGDV